MKIQDRNYLHGLLSDIGKMFVNNEPALSIDVDDIAVAYCNTSMHIKALWDADGDPKSVDWEKLNNDLRLVGALTFQRRIIVLLAIVNSEKREILFSIRNKRKRRKFIECVNFLEEIVDEFDEYETLPGREVLREVNEKYTSVVILLKKNTIVFNKNSIVGEELSVGRRLYNDLIVAGYTLFYWLFSTRGLHLKLPVVIILALSIIKTENIIPNPTIRYSIYIFVYIVLAAMSYLLSIRKGYMFVCFTSLTIIAGYISGGFINYELVLKSDKMEGFVNNLGSPEVGIVLTLSAIAVVFGVLDFLTRNNSSR